MALNPTLARHAHKLVAFVFAILRFATFTVIRQLTVVMLVGMADKGNTFHSRIVGKNRHTKAYPWHN